MADVFGLIGAIGLALAVFFLNKKTTSGKKKPVPSPPENLAADAARQDIQETFEEEVDRIESVRTGDDPATALADLGNARRRR